MALRPHAVPIGRLGFRHSREANPVSSPLDSLRGNDGSPTDYAPCRYSPLRRAAASASSRSRLLSHQRSTAGTA